MALTKPTAVNFDHTQVDMDPYDRGIVEEVPLCVAGLKGATVLLFSLICVLGQQVASSVEPKLQHCRVTGRSF
jgi:hypothetical protein